MTDSQLLSAEPLASGLGRALLGTELFAVIAVDGQDRVREWTGGAERMFGHGREAVLGHDLTEFLVPGGPHGEAVAPAGDATARDCHLEQVALRADGSRFAVDVTVIGTAGPGFVALVRDISERRAAKERIARSEALLAEAEAVTLTGSFDRDLRSGEGTWSSGMYRVFGVPPGSRPPEGARALELIHPEDRGQAAEELAGAVRRRASSFTFPWRLASPEDEERVVAVRGKVLLDDAGEPARLTGTVRDVTADWHAARDRDLLAYVVESSDDAIITKRSDGTITSWNTGAERLYGYTALEAIGRSVAILCPPHRRQEQIEMTRRVFAGESIRHQEAERVRKDGTPLLVSLTISPVRDPSGRIVSAAVLGRDVTERRRLEQRLRHLADHDPLTGLFNRRRFEAELRREVARVERHGGSGAILSIDLDNFKEVNDLHGHAAGDELLCAVAETLQRTLRASDVSSRFGGDEFAVLLPETQLEDVRAVGEHLLAALRPVSIEVDGSIIGVSASIGGVAFSGQKLDVHELLIGADQAMYAAKERGRNRVAVLSRAEVRHARTGSQAAWGREIREALEHDRLVLHLQPIVSLLDGRTKAGELLLRMRRGDHLVEPGAFLGTAERLGLIGEIDQWVARQAVAVLEDGRAPGELPLSINVSADSLSEDSGFLDVVTRELAASGVAPWRLRFEVTEAAAAAQPDHVRQFATRLRALGCSVGLDDFGAGFGSFLHLQHLPIDFIKIDHRFVRHVPLASTEQRLVRAMADVAHGLCIASIAEGVDDASAVERLRETGVDYAQGFHFAAPRPL